MRMFVIVLCSVFLVSQIATAATKSPKGWKVERADQAHVCFATGPVFQDVALSVVMEGPQPLLVISASRFPKESGNHPLRLAINGASSLDVTALQSASTYAVLITRQIADELESANQVDIVIDGETLHFAVKNLSGALDAVARCAGMPLFSKMFAVPPSDVTEAGKWKLNETLPGADICTIRRNGDPAKGDNVDTLLIILGAGRPEWAAWPGQATITLQIDDSPPENVQGNAINSIVLVLIADSGKLDRLQKATRLSWRLPTGDYHTVVTGIDAAITALHTCQENKGSH